MKTYVVYNALGVILKTGHCPADMMELQANGKDEFVIEGQADELSDMVDPAVKIVLKNAQVQKLN